MKRFQDNDATMMAWEAILNMDIDAADEKLPGDNFIKEMDNAMPFREGILKCLIKIGLEFDPQDIAGLKNILQNQYKKNNIKAPAAATIGSWLSGKRIPKRDETSREKVFELCFALEMDATETAEFMIKAYQNRPFNYKNLKEAVWFWCLLNHKGMGTAETIITEVESKVGKTNMACDVYTEQVGREIAEIVKQEDLVEYLVANHFSVEQQHKSAKDRIKQLFPKCYQYAEDELAGTVQITKSIRTPDALLDAIYGYDAYAMKKGEDLTIQDSILPKILKLNWIDRQSFDDIEKGRKVSDEVYRRALILLDFYSFYASAYAAERKRQGASGVDLTHYADEFEDELELILAECGYVQLYKRNPFDWLILSCANTYNPIDSFRDVIYKYFLEATFPQA